MDTFFNVLAGGIHAMEHMWRAEDPALSTLVYMGYLACAASTLRADPSLRPCPVEGILQLFFEYIE